MENGKLEVYSALKKKKSKLHFLPVKYEAILKSLL